MKNLSLLFIAFLLSQLNTLAQQSWFEQTSGTNSTLHSVHFVNENYGWISGEDGVIKNTTNGGQSWNNTAFHGSQTARWYCLWFVNVNDGYAAGSAYIVDRWISNWALTSNGGTSWQWQTSWGNDYSSTRDLFFLDENIGWKVVPRNGEGRVYKTTTGITGFTLLTTLSETLYSIWFVDVDKGWCTGNNGSIYTTIDGGNNWTLQNSGTTKRLRSVQFINSSTGWVVGYGDNQAVMLKTSNGGQSWDSDLPTSIKELNSIFFVDENTGWACGRMASTPNDKGVILYTADGGTNWEVQHIDDNCTEFYTITFVNNAVGWAVGGSGVILKTTTGGIVSVEEEEINEIPSYYNLSQNYPNPFNPSTTIKYQIPELSFVSLKVYDLLGKEVATIVNEELSAGSYKVGFNSRGLTRLPDDGQVHKTLPSGIYLYQLRAGNFAETKKMLLLK